MQYPALYAPPGHKNEKEYNCVQRAHQNRCCLWCTYTFLLLPAAAAAGAPPLPAGARCSLDIPPPMRCPTLRCCSLENLPGFFALLLTAGLRVRSCF